MQRFLIEQEIPGASDLTEQQLAEIAQSSSAAVASLGDHDWYAGGFEPGHQEPRS